MTDIEQKALALLNEVAVERGYNIGAPADRRTHYLLEVACRAIEQHEAFRQEVSDAVEAVRRWTKPDQWSEIYEAILARYLIAKSVDPLVEVLAACDGVTNPGPGYIDDAKVLRAAIEKRGGKIVWGEG